MLSVEEQISAVIAEQLLPDSQLPISTVLSSQSIVVKGSAASVSITLGFPFASIREQLQQQLSDSIAALAGIDSAVVSADWQIDTHSKQNQTAWSQQVKNIIAVASGKGGVGKSTTAVNLALALVKEGAKVGLLDADIYGPSQQLMLGIPEGQSPERHGQQYLLPVEAHGVQSMSMGYLVTESTPMVWRGPMVSGALQQLLNQTSWNNLDYLIIDMPPGTGDIQLTLSQQVPVAGAVIVTTPQDIALLDAKKGIEMFSKVNIPILGIVENMSVHICSNCGQEDHLFGHGGGLSTANDYDVSLLGSLPLQRSIREQVDSGMPTVVAEPEGEIAKRYAAIARNTTAQLVAAALKSDTSFPNISVSDD